MSKPKLRWGRLILVLSVLSLGLAPAWSQADEPPRERLVSRSVAKPTMPADETAEAARDSKQRAGSGDARNLRRKIGQMILVGFPGDTPGHPGFKKVRGQLKDGEITGVLYLGRNLRNRKTVRRMNAALTGAVNESTKPLLAIDQEGGKVQRLRARHGFPATRSASGMARSVSPAKAGALYATLARNLSGWGFNLNLGPVVDLNANPRNPVIGRLGRAYSGDPVVVTRYAAAFVDGHRSNGVLTALKHFPGHGSSRGDSHEGFVDISRTWSKGELEPFRRLIAGGCAELVMSAHVHNGALQAPEETVPVSLSVSALSQVLRKELGFNGVIISDDLQMDAIRENYSLKDAVVSAVAAGTDILLFANDKHPDPDIPAKAAAFLEEAAEKDPAIKAKIEAAFERILALKGRLAGPVEEGRCLERTETE